MTSNWAHSDQREELPSCDDVSTSLSLPILDDCHWEPPNGQEGISLRMELTLRRVTKKSDGKVTSLDHATTSP